MKRILLSALALTAGLSAMAQDQKEWKLPYPETTVYKGEDLEIRRIDEHTWHGNGKMMSNEAIYIIEGEDRAVVLDAGTVIKDYDRIVSQITSKPVTLIATHVHPDHTGSAVNYFDEIYINAADMVNVAAMMPEYKGTIKYLTDGQVIDLGGRELEVIFAPGHTPGSTLFMDKAAGYGFSGDAFGSGYLLLFTNFSTLELTSRRTLAYMKKHNITKMYPGHYMGTNADTQERVEKCLQISRDVLAGKLTGVESKQPRVGLEMQIIQDGIIINYGANALK